MERRVYSTGVSPDLRNSMMKRKRSPTSKHARKRQSLFLPCDVNGQRSLSTRATTIVTLPEAFVWPKRLRCCCVLWSRSVADTLCLVLSILSVLSAMYLQMSLVVLPVLQACWINTDQLYSWICVVADYLTILSSARLVSLSKGNEYENGFHLLTFSVLRRI